MATFESMVDEVRSHLRSYVRDQEASTWLTAGINASDLTLAVNNASVLSRGRVEIDDELIYVDSVSRTGNTATVAPWGRGEDGSTAAAHSANARVTMNPLFPALDVKQAINDTIRSVSGDLWSVASTTLTAGTQTLGYGLPAGTATVRSVHWYPPDLTYSWEPVRRWKFQPNADPTMFPTGKAVDIYSPVVPGADIRVVYTTDLVALTAGQDFTASGLAESARDVVVYGAAFRLASKAEAISLSTRAVEANALDGRVRGADAMAYSRYLFQVHKQRLDEERRRLLDDNPTQLHYVR